MARWGGAALALPGEMPASAAAAAPEDVTNALRFMVPPAGQDCIRNNGSAEGVAS
jgi:hypothetical protein